MKKILEKRKTECLLLGVTAVFLCLLTGLHGYDLAMQADNGVRTQYAVDEETIRALPKQIDLNTADQTALEQLPGIGEELAKRIITYRDEKGGFESVEDLMLVQGIGEKKFAALDGYITVNGGDEP